jgi:hypothetical protein
MTGLSPTGRLVAAAIAAIGWFALGLQYVLIVAATTAAGGNAAGATLNFFSFFTILTNTLVAVVMTRAALGRDIGASLFGAATLYIVVVGLVYSVALRHIWNPQGWQKVADHLLHDAVPLLAVGFWLACVPKGRLAWRDVLPWLIFPFGYLAWSLARGAIDSWYPYYFIDAGKLGYAATLRNAALVTVAFGGLAAGVIGLDRLLGRSGR